MADVIGERLEWLIADRRSSQSAVAREIGVSQPSIGRLINGETRETGKLLELARALRTSPEYLVGETDNPEPDARFEDRQQAFRAPQREHTDDVEISHIDLRYGLGGTYLDQPIEENKLVFPRTWLRQFTDAAPEHLCWAAGQGDSMFPTIGHGEPILIDLGDKTPRMSDLIWAFAYGDIGMIKRLRPLPDGSVEILSDNPNVPPARAVDGELHIIGRVVAVVRRL